MRLHDAVGLLFVFTKSWCWPLKNPVHRGTKALCCDVKNLPFWPSPRNPVLNIKTSAALLRASPRRWAGGRGPNTQPGRWCSSGGCLRQGLFAPRHVLPGRAPVYDSDLDQTRPGPRSQLELSILGSFSSWGTHQACLGHMPPPVRPGAAHGRRFWGGGVAPLGMRLLTAQLWLLVFSCSGSQCSNRTTDVQKRVSMSVKIATTALPC